MGNSWLSSYGWALRACLYARTPWCPARSAQGHPPATSQCRWLASGQQASPDPTHTRPVTGHARRPAPPCPIPTVGPHLLGLSLRLVLRALKLSFSGVSSKDRRTLERRPWQSGADLSHRPGSTDPCVSSLCEPGPPWQLLPTCRQHAVSQQAARGTDDTHLSLPDRLPAPAMDSQQQSGSHPHNGFGLCWPTLVM